MARPLKVKDVRQRIKRNTKVMRENKRVLIANLNAATKGEDFYPSISRAALSDFIKAARAVKNDVLKLKQAGEQ